MNPRRIRASELRTPFKLMAYSATIDDAGQAIADYIESDAIFYGRLLPARGTEPEVARGKSAIVTCRIRVRHSDQIGPKDRFKYGERLFEIVSTFDPDGRRAVVDCDCIEVIDS